jgi:hypothetical protein
MKNTNRSGSAAVVLGLLSMNGLAQAQQREDDQPDPQEERDGNGRAEKPKAGAQASSGLLMADKLCGQQVKNLQQEQIGTVQHILINSNGQIQFAVIDVGEASSSAGRQVAVPWSALRVSNQARAGAEQHEVALTLDADKERLKEAPTFEKDRLDQLDDPATMRRIQTFWRTQRETPSGTGRGN